jgi:hypothetical protein
MDGEYFLGEFCLISGWRSPIGAKIQRILEDTQDQEPSLARLKGQGLDDEEHAQLVVVEQAEIAPVHEVLNLSE